MTQQAAASAAHVKPHWVADLIVGIAGALSFAAVAQAALPIDRPDVQRAEHTSLSLRGAQQIAVAPAVDLPDFVYGEPVEGYDVVSPFGLRKLPWEKGGRLHAGVDIAAPDGYPVQAAADGVVLRAGFDGGYGRFVEVRHAEGLRTLYAHLGGIAQGVRPGAAVKLGQPIGKVGNTGSSSGAHLHFEVHDAKQRPLNPAMFMGRQYATALDLPLKAAARIPRGVRIAYVSYIPKKKRELMEAREAEEAAKKAAAESQQVAVLEAPKTGGYLIRTAPMAVPSATTLPAKPQPSKPQVVQLPAIDYNEPVATWVGGSARDSSATLESVGDLPGWNGSSGG